MKASDVQRASNLLQELGHLNVTIGDTHTWNLGQQRMSEGDCDRLRARLRSRGKAIRAELERMGVDLSDGIPLDRAVSERSSRE